MMTQRISSSLHKQNIRTSNLMRKGRRIHYTILIKKSYTTKKCAEDAVTKIKHFNYGFVQ